MRLFSHPWTLHVLFVAHSRMTSLRAENRDLGLVSGREWDFPLVESVQTECGVHLSTDSVLFFTRINVQGREPDHSFPSRAEVGN